MPDIDSNGDGGVDRMQRYGQVIGVRPEHIEANLRIFDFSLAEEEKQELHRVAWERAVRLSDPEYAPRW